MGEWGNVPSLQSLPAELLLEIPKHLPDIEDFVNLRATCHYFRSTLSSTSPHVLLRLCHRSSHPIFYPKPWLLLSFVARGLSAWSLQSPDNLRSFKTALLHGPGELLHLAVSEPAVAAMADWSLSKMNEIAEWRTRVLRVVSNFMDMSIGQQWKTQPNFWTDAEDAVTLWSDPEETTFHWLVYGELFGRHFDSWLDPKFPTASRTNSAMEFPDGNACSHGAPELHHDIYTRLAYVKYLVSDPSCFRVMHSTGNDVLPYQDFAIPPDDPFGKVIETPFGRFVHPLRAVQASVGPYAPLQDGLRNADRWKTEPQVVLAHLLDRCTLWFNTWQQIREACGGDFYNYSRPLGEEAYFDLNWKQETWNMATIAMGFESFEVLAWWVDQRGLGKDMPAQVVPIRHKMKRFQRTLGNMTAEDEPPTVRLANFAMTTDFPYLLGDVYVCQYK